MTHPEAHKSESTFRLEYAVSTVVDASPEAVWAKLTDAAAMPSWNTTVTRVGGRIAQGERLEIEVPLAPGRTFRPRVAELVPNERMVWSDGFAPMFRGVRTFTLTRTDDGGTRVSMTEVFSGAMLPLVKGSLPDFLPAFSQYAADLRRACEAS